MRLFIVIPFLFFAVYTAIGANVIEAASVDDLGLLEGSWAGSWRSARGNTGMISVKIQVVDPSDKRLKGEFSESGRVVTNWLATGKPNEKGEIVFDGPDRTDTLELKAADLLVGRYAWKTNPSTGTTEFRRK